MGKTLQEIHEDVPANHYDQGIKNNLFQKFWHSRRFKQVLSLENNLKGPILDIGCHSGTFTKRLIGKNNFKEIYGIDISPQAIKLIKKRIPSGFFQVADAVKLPFRSNFFSTIYCLEALEHIDEPEKVIKEIRRVLKKDGKVILLTPSDNKLFKIIWFAWTLYYPVWRHAHVNSFTKNSLEKIIHKTNLKILKVKTFNFGMLKIVMAQK